MDDKNKYNNALEKLQEALAPKNGCKISGLTRACIEEIFPELKELEDERIRRNIIAALKGEGYYDCDLTNECIAWLEKQQSVEEIVERCKDSWYNEGKIAGMAEGLSDDEKYQQGWHDALEKQDEKPQGKTALEAVKEEKVDNANKVEPKFKVKYAGREYNVIEIKEIAGVMYYGIEDEPNHIDYVLPENCEIISGYGVKEKGNSYPTKPTIFSQQNSAWSEEDEKKIKKVMHIVSLDGRISNEECKSILDWLESLKERCTWKPSNIQMECLHDAVEHYHTNGYPASKLNELYEQMSKIYKL